MMEKYKLSAVSSRLLNSCNNSQVPLCESGNISVKDWHFVLLELFFLKDLQQENKHRLRSHAIS